MKIKTLKYLFPKSVTLASIKDAHHSLKFLSTTSIIRKQLKNVISQYIFCISIEFLFIHTCIHTNIYIWLYVSFPYIITVLLFRLSTYGKKFQTSVFCHLLIMCKNKLLPYRGNKTVIALYCQAIIHSKEQL